MIKTSKVLGHECNLITFIEECKTMRYLMNNRDPIFQLQMVPYVALFCKSYLDYFDVDIDEEIEKIVSSLRNNIKAFQGKYSKSIKKILEEDTWQNDKFSDGLKSTVINNNLYYNLGIFCTQNKDIIGNTQITDIELDLYNLEDEEKRQKCFEIGKFFGEFISRIYDSILKSANFVNSFDLGRKIEIYYNDINTNDSLIFNQSVSKENNILLLHTLGKIGFVKHYVEPLFTGYDSWLLRVKYISLHNAVHTICNMCKKIDDGYMHKLSNLIKDNNNLFDSEYRNCMMHYSFIKDGKFIISDDTLDMTKPFFGLVEECFGKSCDDYYKSLSVFRDELETAIKNLLKTTYIKPHRF